MGCLQQGLPLPLSRHVVARPLVNELIRYPSVVVVDSTAGTIHGVQWEVEGDAGPEVHADDCEAERGNLPSDDEEGP